MDKELALIDFNIRLRHYIDIYNMVDKDENISFIKIINIKKSYNTFKIDTELKSDISSFFTNICIDLSNSRTIYLTRHGESQYNCLKKIGCNSSLSSRGIKYATNLFTYFNLVPVLISSTLNIGELYKTYLTFLLLNCSI